MKGTAKADPRPTWTRGALLALVSLLACSGSSGVVEGERSVEIGGKVLSSASIKRALVADMWPPTTAGTRFCTYQVLGQETRQVFLWTLCEEIVSHAGSLTVASGGSGPALLEIDPSADPPRILAVRLPGDGAKYTEGVKAMFPRAIQREIYADTEHANRRVELLKSALLSEARRAGP